MNAITRLAFTHLYTHLAWLYNGIASAASLGEWQAWTHAALAHLRGWRVLELAHGPGHLQAELLTRGFATVGIDLSRQMGRLARDRLNTRRLTPIRLAQADVRRLPFADATFDSVVSTFPTEFINEASTLSEVGRVLVSDGRLVVVPHASIRPMNPGARIVSAVYRLTGQNAPDPNCARRRFSEAGFGFATQVTRLRVADITVWVCDRETHRQTQTRATERAKQT